MLRRPLPLWKRALFSAATAMVLLAGLELLLAACGVQSLLATEDPFVGFAANLPLYVAERQPDGSMHMVTAANKRGLFNLQTFPRTKPPGTYRIFCVGESTTYGSPYDDATSFPAWMREMLAVVDSSRRYEVINAGGISYASYRVAALMQELCAYQPDLFVIYSGHNEFLEERTYAELKTASPAIVQISSLAARSRTYAALHKLWHGPAAKATEGKFMLPGEVDTLLDHAVGPSAYHRDDQLRARVIEHYRLNLHRMIGLAEAAGAEVLLVTPASNLKDCAPFKSEHPEELDRQQVADFREAFRRGKSLHDAGVWQQAELAYNEAARLDNCFAELLFRQAQLRLASGPIAAARIHFLRALEEDVCPLRAPAAIPRIVREAASRRATMLVDFEQLLRDDCQARFGHDLPGSEQFLDHVHPTIEMHRFLAEAILDEMRRRGILMAAADWRQQIKDVSMRIHARINPQSHAEALRNVAKLYNWAGKLREAGPLALAALQTIPEDREGLLIAGEYWKLLGKWQESAECYRKALLQEVALDPADVDTRLYLGDALMTLNRPQEAREQFLKAIELRPGRADAHRRLAAALNSLGDRDAARVSLQEALRLDPNDATAKELLLELNELP